MNKFDIRKETEVKRERNFFKRDNVHYFRITQVKKNLYLAKQGHVEIHFKD